MKRLYILRLSSKTIHHRYRAFLSVSAAALISLSIVTASSQSLSQQQRNVVTIEGTVRNSAGAPIAGASVFLDQKGQSTPVETKTNADGAFIFPACRADVYTVRAEKSGLRNAVTDSLTLSAGTKKHIILILENLDATHPTSSGTSQPSPSAEALEFEDKPISR